MVRFDPEYPFKSPAVQFVVSDMVKPPVHPVRFVPWFWPLITYPNSWVTQSTSTRTATYVRLLDIGSVLPRV
jgi:hypothetical protein